MCTPSDPCVAFGLAGVVAVIAASLMSARGATSDQRRFTFPQMGMFVGIIGLVLLIFYSFFNRCTVEESRLTPE